LNTTDQEHWLYDLIDATARPTKRQRTASSEKLSDWSQPAISDNNVSAGNNAEDEDCSENKDDMVESMLMDFAENLNPTSWGEPRVPDPDEWDYRLYKMDDSPLGEYPLRRSC
jgi:hypothetical protein